MGLFLEELAKPQWWLSVVVAGIAINLVSAYLKHPLDRFLVATPAWVRARSERRRNKYRAFILDLRASADARQMAMFFSIRRRQSSIQFLIFSLIFLAIPPFAKTMWSSPSDHLADVLSLGGAALTFFASFRMFWSSSTLTVALLDARSGKEV